MSHSRLHHRVLSCITLIALLVVSVQGHSTSATTDEYQVHSLARFSDVTFENLAIRSNGQILSTTTSPNASIYQFDPRGAIPPTIVSTIPNTTSATGITEGEPDVFYVASSNINYASPLSTKPETYFVTQLDMRGVSVLPDGTLSRRPATRRVANLPDAALLNGAAFAGPRSDHLLVADTFRGLIWNVNVQTGAVGVAINDTTTKGPAPTGPNFYGANGIKAQNGTLYWTNTGAASMYKVPIDNQGNVIGKSEPALVASDLSCDDFALDNEGNAYVAGPVNVITKVSPSGAKQVIAGVSNSTKSDLGGPTAVRFGRLVRDSNSIYVTTDGGILDKVPDSAGLSRIDLKQSD